MPTNLFTVLRPAAFIFMSIILFGSGHLSSISLATLEAAKRGIGGFGLGMLTSLPFVGLWLGAICMPYMLRRTRHVRLIALATASCSLSLMFLPYIESLFIWGILRFIYGFSAAGVWLCCDLWMAHLSDESNRGKLLAFYQMIVLSGLAIGQVLLITSGDNADFGFVVAAAVMVSAVIPICSTKLDEPTLDVSGRKLSLRMAFRVAPLPLVGSLFSGLCFSNFAFILLHYNQIGAKPTQVASLGFAIVAAGAAGQIIVGFLSDKVKDRRHIMMPIILLSIVALIGMGFTGITYWWATMLLSLVYGACIVTLYPLNISLAGDFVSKDLFGPMAAKCFLCIMVGNMCGPLFSGIALIFAPEFGVFIFITITLVVLAMATMSRRLLASHQPTETEDFSPLVPLGTNPELTDPRAQPRDTVTVTSRKA